jgi:hypothetical protein
MKYTCSWHVKSVVLLLLALQGLKRECEGVTVMMLHV